MKLNVIYTISPQTDFLLDFDVIIKDKKQAEFFDYLYNNYFKNNGLIITKTKTKKETYEGYVSYFELIKRKTYANNKK
jgi:hypothetical protein